MNLDNRIQAFDKLGKFLTEFSSNYNKPSQENSSFQDFKTQLELSEANNRWFSQEHMLFALKYWGHVLSYKNLKTWTQAYDIRNIIDPKCIAIIMAGNIPLVGFHDFLSVLISGYNVVVKLSSNDKYLLPYLATFLKTIAPDFETKITFTEDKLKHFDAVIATGSNNTSRYFEYYFRNKPSIIRKNRNSIAILSGNETSFQLKALSEDIFRYYGLGCRNVSKLFVPEGYDFKLFFEAIYHWHPIINHVKYANNYDYNKAVYLMSEYDILENGFFIIKEDQGHASPIATLFYEFYGDKNTLKQKLKAESENIQCVVSQGFFENEIAFGNTQQPKLWDYADQEDTICFLLSL